MVSISFIYLWYISTIIIISNKIFQMLSKDELKLVIFSIFAIYAYVQSMTLHIREKEGHTGEGYENLLGSAISILIVYLWSWI